MHNDVIITIKNYYFYFYYYYYNHHNYTTTTNIPPPPIQPLPLQLLAILNNNNNYNHIQTNNYFYKYFFIQYSFTISISTDLHKSSSPIKVYMNIFDISKLRKFIQHIFLLGFLMYICHEKYPTFYCWNEAKTIRKNRENICNILNYIATVQILFPVQSFRTLHLCLRIYRELQK